MSPTEFGRTCPFLNVARKHGVEPWIAYAYADHFLHGRDDATTEAAVDASPEGMAHEFYGDMDRVIDDMRSIGVGSIDYDDPLSLLD